MPLDVGVNFRATSGYVTDGTGETYDLGAAYPVTRGGLTFGWSADLTGNARDRDSGAERRFAGINQLAGGESASWRADLTSSGSHNIHFSQGDVTFGASYLYCILKDDTTGFQTIDDSGGAATDRYQDTAGTEHTQANWPGSHASANQTFSSTIFRVTGGDGASKAWKITHIRIEEVGGGATGNPWYAYAQQ